MLQITADVHLKMAAVAISHKQHLVANADVISEMVLYYCAKKNTHTKTQLKTYFRLFPHVLWSICVLSFMKIIDLL